MTRRFSLLGLWLVACAHSSHSEIAVQQSEHSESRSVTNQQVVTQTVTGPETITTTIEEFAAAEPQQVPVPAARAVQVGVGAASVALKPPPVLIKRTTIVDHREPATTDTRLNASTALQTKADQSLNSKTTTSSKLRAGPDPFTWLALACGAVLAVGLLLKVRPWKWFLA